MYPRHLFLFLTIFTLPAQATRYALVIGNENYAHFASLHNPRADAEDMAAALQAAAFGFQVTKLLDANLRTMQTAIENFIQQLRQTDEALVYYSGHGLQYRGGNYLVPIDAQPKTGADVPYAMVNAQQVLDNLQEVNGKGINLLILDACRNSPFKSITKSTAVGLANMQAVGSLVLYAAAPGNAALGNENLRNSIYTHHLLKVLRDPTVYNSSIFDVQTRIAAAVSNDTQGAQLPWQEGSLTQTFCLVQPCGGGLASPPPVAMIKPPQPVKSTIHSDIKRSQDRQVNDNSVLLLNSKNTSFHLSKKLHRRIKLLYTMLAQASTNDLLAADESLNEISALPALNHSNSQMRQKAREINQQGIALLNIGNYLGAAQLFQQALNLDLADTEIAGNFGYALMLQDKFDEAKPLFIHSLAINPERSISWVMLGQAIAPVNSLDEVVGCLRLALRYSKNVERLKVTIMRVLNNPNQLPKVHAAIELVMAEL